MTAVAATFLMIIFLWLVAWVLFSFLSLFHCRSLNYHSQCQGTRNCTTLWDSNTDAEILLLLLSQCLHNIADIDCAARTLLCIHSEVLSKSTQMLLSLAFVVLPPFSVLCQLQLGQRWNWKPVPHPVVTLLPNINLGFPVLLQAELTWPRDDST